MAWFKRSTVLFLGLIIIATTGITAHASETSITVRVTCDATLVSNNHVGDDWENSYTVTYNGETYDVLLSGTEIEIEPGDTITMTADIEEYDDSKSDTASESWDLTFDEAGLGAYGEETMTITVRENDGRYSGNTATWEVYWHAEVVAVPEKEDEEGAEVEEKSQQGHQLKLYDSSGREIKGDTETTPVTEPVEESEPIPKGPGLSVFVYGTSSTYHVTSYCPDREDGDVKVYAYDSALEEGFKPCNTCVDKSANSYRKTPTIAEESETAEKTEALSKEPVVTVFVYGTSSTYHATAYCPDRENGNVAIYTRDSAAEKGFKPCKTCVNKTVNIGLYIFASAVAIVALLIIYFVYSRFKAESRKVQPGPGKSLSTAKAALVVQRLKKPGAKAKFSFGQVVYLISNTQDAKKNLTPKEYEKFIAIFQSFRSKRTRIAVDMSGYLKMCFEIIEAYEDEFPYMLVNGSTSKNLELRDRLKIRTLYEWGLLYEDAVEKFQNERDLIPACGANYLSVSGDIPDLEKIQAIVDFVMNFAGDSLAQIPREKQNFTDYGYLLGLADAMLRYCIHDRVEEDCAAGIEDDIALCIAVCMASRGISDADIATTMGKRKEISDGHTRYFRNKNMNEISIFCFESIRDTLPITDASKTKDLICSYVKKLCGETITF